MIDPDPWTDITEPDIEEDDVPDNSGEWDEPWP